jgi:hypothetical protein
VGLYAGDRTVGTQNAWQAAFNGGAFDASAFPPGAKNPQEGPGVSALTLFYVLLFLLFALPLTVACIVLHFHHVKVPPAVERFVPWRWGIAAVVNFVVFLFLALQLAVGFKLEERAREMAGQLVPPKDASAEQATVYLWAHAGVQEGAERTVWLRLAFLLHVLVILGAGFMYWVSQHGAKRAMPRLELMW